MSQAQEATPAPLLRYEIRRFDWSATELRASLVCLPAIAISLAIGILLGHRSAAMVVAGGAQTVGFGAFQKRLWFRGGPMVLAAIGIALSATVGEIAARDHLLLLLVASLWSFLYGMSGAISSPASWVGQQCCVFLVVSSAVPGTMHEAGMRGLGVLAGGALQVCIVLFCWQFVPPPRSSISDPEIHQPGWQRRAVADNLTLASPVCRYAIRLMITTVVAMVLYLKLGFGNAYWIPMTSIIIMKPDRLLSDVRAVNRVLGTLVGAGLITLLVAVLRPDSLMLAMLVLITIYAAYALQSVNYGVFAIFITGYIAFLLAIGRLPEQQTVEHRVLATSIAGGLVMLSYAIYRRTERERAARPVKA